MIKSKKNYRLNYELSGVNISNRHQINSSRRIIKIII